MRLSRVTVRNFRNFDRIDVEHLPSSVVLVGENGAGKSNLLTALRLVLDPSLPDTARQLGAEDFWDGLAAPFGGNEIEVSVELTDFDDDPAAQAALDKCFVSRDPLVARLTYLFRPAPSFGADGDQSYEFLVFGGGEEPHTVDRTTRRFLAMRVLPALRDAEAELGNWTRSPLRQLLQRLDIPPAHLEQLASELRGATDTLLEDPAIAGLSNEISRRIHDMVGDLFAVSTQLGIGALRPEQVLRSVRLFLQGEKIRTLAEASLGNANVVYLALLLQVIAAQRHSHELVSTVLGVEEPEAHLHPHLQRVLFRYMLRTQDMLWVTTHSTHIASVAPLASLVLLRVQDGASNTFVPTAAGLSPREVADIERYLDVTRAELLFAKGVVLVEGSAELYLVPALAQMLGFDLDALGISVCAVHGADFSPYVRILATNALAVPYVVITDGDAKPDRRGISQAGLHRAVRLVPADERAEVQAAIDANDYALAKSLLETSGIFVGDETLELDLAVDNAARLIEVLESIGLRQPSVRKLEEAIPIAIGGDAGASDVVMQIIERIGKGRLAQRLAGYAGDLASPTYVASAIREIVRRVRPDEPRPD